MLVGLALLPVLGAAAWVLRRGRGVVQPASVRVIAFDQPAPVVIPEHARPAAAAPVGVVAAPEPREILQRLYAVAFDGAPVDDSSVAARSGHVEVVAATMAVLDRIETQPRYARRRPQLLPQLMGAVNDPDASLRRIATIIAQDPALAGNLLRITNSAMYRVQSRPVESIERAVTVVGTEGIRLMIAAVLVQPVMNVGGSVFGRFPTVVWEHTLLAATAAADRAKLLEGEDAFAAQLLGLLHGLGSIIVVQVLRDEYARRPA